MDFNLKQWRDHESEDEQQQTCAKIPRQLLLESPQQQQQQQHEAAGVVAALPLFVSAESHNTNKMSSSSSHHNLSSYPDQSSTPTAIPTSASRYPKGVGGRYCFSMAQWQELELQALIYRHMMAGATVPPELLQLVKKSLLTSPTSPYYLHYPPHFQSAALLQAGYWGKGSMDPEPGRCRRTDGKKWRCSRDVVAGHKYCERHMHRGRNRSRKPVEFPAAATAAAAAAAPPANDVESLSHKSSNASSFAVGSVAGASHFSLSGSGAPFDAFQLNTGSAELRSDKRNPFDTQQHDSTSSGGGGDGKSNSRVLMHLFDDWPKSDNADNNGNLSSTSLTISTPGNPTSDFLRLSTGNGDELGQRDRNGNGEREQRSQISWTGGWGGNSVASMGGPLAEALRSSSNSSPTSVLHQLPRCSAPDTSYVSA